MIGALVSAAKKQTRRTSPKAKDRPGTLFTRVLVCAATAEVGSNLEALLERTSGIRVLGSVAADSLPKAIADHDPDVVVWHWAGNTIPAVGDLPHSGVPFVVMLGGRVGEVALARLISSGVSVLLSSPTAEELAAAVHCALANLVAMPIEIASSLMNNVSEQAGQPTVSEEPDADDDTPEQLTARERQVLEMMMEGLSNKEIAEYLKVSAHTVKFHISSILGKLGASSRTEAATIGLRRGLITI